MTENAFDGEWIRIAPLQTRLEIASTEVVALVMSETKSALDAEAKAMDAIATRATGQLAACGVSLGLLFAFGASVVRSSTSTTATTLFCVALILVGASALICSFGALRVKGLPFIGDKILFNAEALGRKPDDYKKLLIAHYAEVRSQLGAARARRGAALLTSQYFYLAFLCSITALGAISAH